MYVCVLPLTNTKFFLYILSIFPFFTPFCNRQMKVKKKECIEYIRRFKDDEAKRHQESSTTFCFFSLFLFLSVYLFRSFFSHCMIRLWLLVLCVQTAATAGFRPFTTILYRPSFCTLHPIYTIQRLFFLAFPSSSSVFFSKKNQY